jgi:hypothetical protein
MFLIRFPVQMVMILILYTLYIYILVGGAITILKNIY